MAMADGKLPAVYEEPLTIVSTPVSAAMAKTETLPELAFVMSEKAARGIDGHARRLAPDSKR